MPHEMKYCIFLFIIFKSIKIYIIIIVCNIYYDIHIEHVFNMNIILNSHTKMTFPSQSESVQQTALSNAFFRQIIVG